MAEEKNRQAVEKLRGARSQLLSRYPFFGYIAMHLQLGVADVETACTDGRRIIFDPNFLERLGTEEIFFVFCHEILHICLKHIARREEKEPFLWNLACDIVVNSNICASLGIDSMSIDGQEAMTKAPSGEEGYQYTAEEMYDILINKVNPETLKKLKELGELVTIIIDNHEYWPESEPGLIDQYENTKMIEESIRHFQGALAAYRLPPALQKIEIEMINRKQVIWKDLCRDFIRKLDHSGSDYNYKPPERRILQKDIILPGFNKTYDEKTKDVFVFVDKSGSIEKRQIMTIMNEIIYAVKENCFTGKMTFFDTMISDEIVSFSEAKDILRSGVPVTGGGTDFYCIFEYVSKLDRNSVSGIIIMTDGYAFFPPESIASGLPVLWIIVGSDVKPPWGKYVNIEAL